MSPGDREKRPETEEERAARKAKERLEERDKGRVIRPTANPTEDLFWMEGNGSWMRRAEVQESEVSHLPRYRLAQ